MKKLSPDKRKQLALTAVVVVGVIAGLWFGLVNSQKQHLTKLGEAKEAAAAKLKLMQASLRLADSMEAEVTVASDKLAALEENMATGDLYSWAIYLVRQFKTPYKIDIPQFSQIDGPKDVTLLPGFPYKQASITVGGTAQYNELGRFISDFENAYPYFRISNLTVEPQTANSSAGKESLSFRMDIVALVKPSVS